MKWKRCSPSRAAGSPLLTSRMSSSSSGPGWSSWTSLLRMWSSVFYMSQSTFQFLSLSASYSCPRCLKLWCGPVCLSVRTSCIRHGTSTFCLCPGGACCVNSGWRSRACWGPSSTLMSTSSTWSHMTATCSPWSMKVLSGCVQLVHPRYRPTSLLLYSCINSGLL